MSATELRLIEAQRQLGIAEAGARRTKEHLTRRIERLTQARDGYRARLDEIGSLLTGYYDDDDIPTNIIGRIRKLAQRETLTPADVVTVRRDDLERVEPSLVDVIAAEHAEPVAQLARCCFGPADGTHALNCPQRCQDCGGDVDGPARCRCLDGPELVAPAAESVADIARVFGIPEKSIGEVNGEPVAITDLAAAFVELGEIVRVHLAEAEAKGDYVTFGPEPSDRVAELIKRLQ